MSLTRKTVPRESASMMVWSTPAPRMRSGLPSTATISEYVPGQSSIVLPAGAAAIAAASVV